MTALCDPFASTPRDPARSYEPLDEADLERLGRAADAELKAFFGRNAHLVGWRERLRVIALCQGGAEHYLRGRRGVWDLDVMVCFAHDPTLRGSGGGWWSPGIGATRSLGAVPRPARLHGPRG